MVYLDNAATTYPKPDEVYAALDFANRNFAFNAGRGSYDSAKKTFRMIQETRREIADFVSADENNVVFTSSATEALNLIINGLDFTEGDTVYISPFEHNAIVRPLHNLVKTKGINVKTLPFNKETWVPEIEIIENLFALNKPKAILLSHVSNVTGYILPFEKIFGIAKKYGATTVLDCAQSFGVVKVDVTDTDFIVFAGHKSLYASFGIAGFITLHTPQLAVTKSGGTGSDSLNPDMPTELPGRYEAGSPNSVAIAGLHASVQWLKGKSIFAEELKLTNYLLKRVSELPNVLMYLPKNGAVFGILSLNIKNYSADDIGTILSEDYNICVRTGYHCAPLVHDFIGSREYSGTVRVSLGAFNSPNDVDQLVEALSTF